MTVQTSTRTSTATKVVVASLIGASIGFAGGYGWKVNVKAVTPGGTVTVVNWHPDKGFTAAPGAQALYDDFLSMIYSDGSNPWENAENGSNSNNSNSNDGDAYDEIPDNENGDGNI